MTPNDLLTPGHCATSFSSATRRALDLVAIGFAKPARFYGNTISTKEDLLAASNAFMAHYLQVCVRVVCVSVSV